MIQAADIYNNELSIDIIALLDAPVITPAGPTIALTSEVAGQALVSFVSSSTGTFSVAISAGGQSVQGSPVQVDVVASLSPETSMTVAWGSLLDGMPCCRVAISLHGCD